jgi:hypothetical protein
MHTKVAVDLRHVYIRRHFGRIKIRLIVRSHHDVEPSSYDRTESRKWWCDEWNNNNEPPDLFRFERVSFLGWETI